MDQALLVIVVAGTLLILAVHLLVIRPKLSLREGGAATTLNWPRLMVALGVLVAGVVLGNTLWPPGDETRYYFGLMSSLISLSLAGTSRRHKQ